MLLLYICQGYCFLLPIGAYSILYEVIIVIHKIILCKNTNTDYINTYD